MMKIFTLTSKAIRNMPLAELVLAAVCSAVLCATPAYSGFVRDNDQESIVVFVHGYASNAQAAWKNVQTNIDWLSIIANDDDLKDFDIYVHEFNTVTVGETTPIGEIVGQFKVNLHSAGVLRRKNIIFVGHSMGGLIIRKFIVDFSGRPYISNIRAIMMYGAPTQGSNLAAIASALTKWMGENRQLEQLLPYKNGNYVDDLQESWLRKGFDIPTFCAYEGKKTFNVMVVNKESAISFCSRQPLRIEENHIDMVKPPASGDFAAHDFLKLAVNQTVRAIPIKAFIVDSYIRKNSIPRIQNALRDLQNKFNITLEPLILSEFPKDTIIPQISRSQPRLIVIHRHAFKTHSRDKCVKCDDKILNYMSAIYNECKSVKFLVYSQSFRSDPGRGERWLENIKRQHSSKNGEGMIVYPKYLDQIKTMGIEYSGQTFPQNDEVLKSDLENNVPPLLLN
jgi:hypothetical protein